MPQKPSNKLNKFFSNLEDKHVLRRNFKLAKRGYFVKLLPYAGFGTSDKVIMQLRATLDSPKNVLSFLRRGIFSIRNKQLTGITVSIKFDGVDEVFEAKTDRGGYIIGEFLVHLEPGWHDVKISVPSKIQLRRKGKSVQIETPEQNLVAKTRVHIIDASSDSVGIISDIDDTVLVSNAPRPLIALKNMLLASPHRRKAVPGMADFYNHLLEVIPNSFLIYLSAGPWNQYNFLKKFIVTRNLPWAPIILQDIGPDEQKLFESTRPHKNEKISKLFQLFPQTKWILIGDDGQYDQEIYKNFALNDPDRIKAIVIRQLTAPQQVLNSVAPFPLHQGTPTAIVPIVFSTNGRALQKLVDKII